LTYPAEPQRLELAIPLTFTTIIIRLLQTTPTTCTKVTKQHKNNIIFPRTEDSRCRRHKSSYVSGTHSFLLQQKFRLVSVSPLSITAFTRWDESRIFRGSTASRTLIAFHAMLLDWSWEITLLQDPYPVLDLWEWGR
jgi:hypothetical protein